MASKPEEQQQTVRFCELTRAGVTIALISFFSVVSIEILKRIPFLNSDLHIGVCILVLTGFIMLLTDIPSLLRAWKHEEILRFIRKRYYWGLVLLFSAAVVYAFCPAPVPPPPAPIMVVRAQEPEPQPEPEPPPPPEFPELRVSAVVLNGSRSSATVNGRDTVLGDGLLGVTVVAITSTNVTFEMQGLLKVVPFGQ